jgi:protein tyrosine/serine phosphatase
MNRKTSTTALTALLAFWCMSVGIGASRSATGAKHKQAEKQDANGLVKFAEVTPHLYRGGQPTAEGLVTLKKMGIAVVVDMRSGDRKSEKAAVEKLGMQYYKISWHCPFPSDEPFARLFKVIRENPDKKVFVHCRLGDDRTGMAVAAYRMSEQDWSADEAMDEMKEFGFRGAHHLTCPGLASYEKSFPDRLKTGKAFTGLNANSEASGREHSVH